MSEIKFGTDGWRAIERQDFNRDNVDKVINAIASYIYKESGYLKPVIAGYDPRNKADEYALYIAEKMAEFGFDVELSSKVVATPVLAYSALKKNAYAIMITASHNPGEYLGIKFIPPYGGPAEDSMVKDITANLDTKFKKTVSVKTFKKVSFEDDYINHIKGIIDFETIRKSGLKINYDAHHGAAGALFVRILNQEGIENISQNMERDIYFGGFLPDPKEKYLPALKKLCKENHRTGFSNDGDGDRFGVFDEEGVFISPNDIIAMLLGHLVKNKNFSGKLAKTVGASSMLDIAAEKIGISTVETPVGFKWLGSVMRNDDIIIAGEESGGLSIKGHIPEKDGILANLLIMEMIAYSSKTLHELHCEFKKSLPREFLTDRLDIKLESSDFVSEIMNKFKSADKIGKYNVIKTNTLDGIKLYLEDGSSLLVRKSGTEPLLRVYFESDKEEKISELFDNVKQLC